MYSQVAEVMSDKGEEITEIYTHIYSPLPPHSSPRKRETSQRNEDKQVGVKEAVRNVRRIWERKESDPKHLPEVSY